MKSELITIGIPPERIRIIYNSTDIPTSAAHCAESRMAIRRKLGLKYEKIAVFVGRLSEEKNIDVLIDAWELIIARHPDAHLMLLGEGGAYRNVEQQLRDQVDSLGLDDVIHFLGHVENAKDYVLASDVFVLPTRTEGMSNALVEAFACGAAIVATDIAANREICEDGVNSILVPPSNVEELAKAINSVLDSPELGARLGKAARRKAEEELTTEKMIESYLDVYRQALTQ
jgi:glycosyltransferase involved in cell wall biosynthesis